MIDFTKLEEGQIVLFDFEGKTYEREIKYGTANIPEVDEPDFYFHYGDLDIRSKLREYVCSSDYNYNIWFTKAFKKDVENLNVRFKPKYNFHVGQKVSYLYDGEESVGTVKMGNVNPNAMLIFNDNDIAIATICIKDEWCDEIIKLYQVKPITITDMERETLYPYTKDFFPLGQYVRYTQDDINYVGVVNKRDGILLITHFHPFKEVEKSIFPSIKDRFAINDIPITQECIEKYKMEPLQYQMNLAVDEFDQQIIDAKLELGSWMVSRHAEMNLVGDKVRQTNNKIRLIEKQRRMYNAEQLWNRLRDQVVSNEDENGDEKFYDMIQDLELYYETKLKPVTNTPKEFTSNDGC